MLVFYLRFFRYCLLRIRLISFFCAKAYCSFDFLYCRFLLSVYYLILIYFAYNFCAYDSLACLLFSYYVFYFYFYSSYCYSYSYIRLVYTTLLKSAYIFINNIYIKNWLNLIIEIK